jgi:hypothetical protein
VRRFGALGCGLLEQRRDQLHALLETLHALAQRREGDVHGDVFGLVPAGAEAELHPAAADVVDGGRFAGQHRRLAEGHRRHHRAEEDSPRVPGKRGEDRPRLERLALLAADGHQVVTAEDPREAGGLGGQRKREELIVGPPLLRLEHEEERVRH